MCGPLRRGKEALGHGVSRFEQTGGADYCPGVFEGSVTGRGGHSSPLRREKEGDRD